MFRWIKRKWNGVKDKCASGFHNTTVYNFKEFIEVLGKIGIGAGTINIALMLMAIGITSLGVPVVGVWLSYIGMCILMPMAIMGIIFNTVHYFYLKKLDNDIQWWTYRRAEKFQIFFGKATFWSSVIYGITILFMVTSPFHASIFVAHALPNVVALRLLIMDMFWIPMCVVMSTLPWINLLFVKFKYHLREVEWERIENRESRSTGSMSDWCSEDDILDHKLARMGL